MGRTHIDGLGDVPESEVVAITDPANIGNAGPELAKEYGIDYENNIESLVSRSDIDAVVVTTPHSLHAEHTLLAINAGKHVLCEKPMEVTLEKCDRMLKTAKEKKVKLMIAQSHRYWEGDKVVKSLIDEGAIGKIITCRDTITSSGYRKIEPDSKLWMFDLNLYGKGGLIAWGIHDVDRLRWLLDSEAEQVFARSYNLRTDVKDDITTNSIMITFNNNATVHMWYSQAFPEPGWKRSGCSMEIVGDEGLIDFDPYESVKVARKETGKWETVYGFGDFAEERQKAFSSEDRDFIKSIVEDKTPPVTGEDGRKAVEIVVAAYKSSEIKNVVNLPL